MKDTEKLIADAVDHLTYSSYIHNRKLSPEIEPASWGLVYGAKKVEIMEKNFKKALTIA
jgi:hypothetical protein